jgi:hypothetical protein
LLPPEALGTGIGLYQALTGVAALGAGLWAGFAWGGDGKLPLLVSGIGAAAIATVLLADSRRR